MGTPAAMRIRALLLAVAMAIIGAAVPFGMALGQGETSQNQAGTGNLTKATIPPDLLSMLRSDLKEDRDDIECLGEPGSPPLQAQVEASWFALNRSQPPGLLVWELAPCLGGTANGEMLVYIHPDSGWRMIFHGFGHSLTLCTESPPCRFPTDSARRSTPARGWPDLALWRAGLLASYFRDQLVYSFDGRAYRATAGYHVPPVSGPRPGRRPNTASEAQPRPAAGLPRSSGLTFLSPGLRGSAPNSGYIRFDPHLDKSGIPGDAPLGLLAALRTDLKRDLEELGLTLKECVDLERFDHGQPQAAWLAWLPCRTGANIGEFYLYARSGNGWRQILHGFGTFWQVCAKADPPCPAPWSKRRSSSAHGWPDLAVWEHYSVNEQEQTIYRFDGQVYTKVACRIEHAAAPEPTYSPCPQ